MLFCSAYQVDKRAAANVCDSLYKKKLFSDKKCYK